MATNWPRNNWTMTAFIARHNIISPNWRNSSMCCSPRSNEHGKWELKHTIKKYKERFYDLLLKPSFKSGCQQPSQSNARKEAIWIWLHSSWPPEKKAGQTKFSLGDNVQLTMQHWISNMLIMLQRGGQTAEWTSWQVYCKSNSNWTRKLKVKLV